MGFNPVAKILGDKQSKEMTITGEYSRECDRCGKEVDRNVAITIRKKPNNLHLCQKCGTGLLQNVKWEPTDEYMLKKV